MKMLTLNDFIKCSFDQKCQVVTIQADYLMSREFPNGTIYLYQSNSFFIEVAYSPIKKKILKINAFSDPKQLEAYADTVSLADLFL